MNKTDYCLSLHTAYASKKKKKYHSLKLLAYLSSTNLVWLMRTVVACAGLPDNLNLVTLIEPNGRVVPPVST